MRRAGDRGRSLFPRALWRSQVLGVGCAGTEGAGTGAHGFFVDWQSHRSMVPRVTTGHSSLVAEDEGPREALAASGMAPG